MCVFAAIMFIAKFYIKHNAVKHALAIVSYLSFIFLVDLHSLPYTYYIVINKWSILTACYVLLLDNILFPLIAGLYPALRIFMLLPESRAGLYPIGKIIGTANGQICFTITLVLIYQLFGKVIIERNKYKKMSITDSLTGVATFAHTIETAEKMIQSGGISILITDMDRFKQINDTFGHVAGNKVLIKVSEFLKAETEGLERIIGRLGGDEFIIVVRNDGKNERVKNLAEHLSKAIREKQFVIDEELDPIRLSFSVGQANSSPYDKDTNIEKLLNKADIDMYFNKCKNHRLDIFTKNQKPQLPKEGFELLNVLAEKDMYTYVHSRYTAHYAAALAKEVGLPDNQVELIYAAGWLHDIGKILISSDIIRKNTTLTPEEYVLIKEHVSYGLNIINNLSLPVEIVNCIAYHHENWDGTGYPNKLSGESIPLEARILQLADSYSAMIVRRVYRKTLSPEDALNEIISGCGKQFDPKLVKIFENLIRNKFKAA
jgi:diguanylate cyclase (GGDEF)-like protein/putative nucleotidyltransferase with HDIG domain